MKAVPSSSNSNNWLHSFRPLMPNSMGQSTDKDKAGLYFFGMKFTQEKARQKWQYLFASLRAREHNLHALSSVTWSHKITHNFHAHSSVL
jgi:hypothetical protein